MNKQIPGHVVVGLLTLVAVIVGMLAWKYVLAPPAPAGFYSFTKEQMQELGRKHAASVAQARAEQLRLYAASHPGWKPAAAEAKGGPVQTALQGRSNAGQGK